MFEFSALLRIERTAWSVHLEETSDRRSDRRRGNRRNGDSCPDRIREPPIWVGSENILQPSGF
jgi:hypothetical protein